MTGFVIRLHLYFFVERRWTDCHARLCEERQYKMTDGKCMLCQCMFYTSFQCCQCHILCSREFIQYLSFADKRKNRLVHGANIASLIDSRRSSTEKTKDTLVPHSRLMLFLVHQGATVAPTRLRRLEVVGVATATAVHERLAGARGDVIIPASDGGAARTSQRRQTTSTCQRSSANHSLCVR